VGFRQSSMEGLGMTPDFWRGKRVLVTGHTGFKGSWLCLWLQKTGAIVCGYSLGPPTEPNMFDVADVVQGMTSINGDIRDLECLKAVFAEHRPEIVIHMAAQALVRDSYSIPVETYATNVMGTVHVLEAIRVSKGVRVAIIITSDKCYENKEWIWGYRENDPMGGHDPYSSSKGCAELITSAYRRAYFEISGSQNDYTAIASVRAGNVIGGGDWGKDRLVPDIMAAFMQGEAVVIRNPNAIRPWQHVLDPLNGYLCLAERLWTDSKYAEAWNFGPQSLEAKPVGWIVKELTSLWGDGAEWKLESDRQGPHEATDLKLDSAKARMLLGWRSRLDIFSALEWVVEWYKSYHEGYNMKEFTEAQIVRYEKII
jgi:CDP-glucose 4,6-dehydratase